MLNPTTLNQFTGTEGYHRWSVLFPNMLLTDGAMYVAENGGQSGAYWLMDAIASHQPALRKHKDTRLQDMQFWFLKVSPDKKAVLECWADTGEGEKPVVVQKIEYSDFDLPEIKLYVGPVEEGGRRVILLPSEY
jgi:hypothetical protein